MQESIVEVDTGTTQELPSIEDLIAFIGPNRRARRLRGRKVRQYVGRDVGDMEQVDNSPFTKPALGRRKRIRRARNKVAKQARKVNRGVYSGQ